MRSLSVDVCNFREVVARGSMILHTLILSLEDRR